ncbi:hypothetical protein SAMN05444372_102323 [Flavobacterium micromati]|jgi:hypothetical protein|uniref:Uncharacterized protein n=1 Tax=Flavobacterium micromati TaxID=229205 RepID=A0A1M5H7E1_9FLAO|nr:hypothetical protein SAMN05444372_102323 [Flavobacterium micromati]
MPLALCEVGDFITGYFLLNIIPKVFEITILFLSNRAQSRLRTIYKQRFVLHHNHDDVLNLINFNSFLQKIQNINGII